MARRLNIGCGQTPTDGWRNYDNSWSVRLAARPIFSRILRILGLLSKSQREFIAYAKKANIQWADATRHIPERDGSVAVIYSSHMLEHLDRKDAGRFLQEARRVLRSGGVIRIAVPDIKYHVEEYLKNGDADSFIGATRLTRAKPKRLMEKMAYLMIGDRQHQWMYDGNSLCRMLSVAGFRNAQVMEPGCTIVPEPGALNLTERIPESVFVEAVSP